MKRNVVSGKKDCIDKYWSEN